jgi:hypothetical protein
MAETYDDLLKPDGFLPYFFELEEKKAWKWSWSAFTVTALGVLWFSLGCLCTMSGFVNLGNALITEGVNDLLNGAVCLWKGEQITLKDYLKSKLISIAVSAVTFGIGKFGSFIKKAYSGGLKSAWQSASNFGGMMSSAGGKITGFFSGAKQVFSMAFSKSAMKEGWKKFGWQVIKTTVITLATNASTAVTGRLVDYGFDQVYPVVEEEVKKSVKEKAKNLAPDLRKLLKLPLEERKELVEKLWKKYIESQENQASLMAKVWPFLDSVSGQVAARIQTPVTK